MKDITPKQIAVLYILSCVLIVIVGVKYLILPSMEKLDKAKEELSAVTATYNELVIQSNYAEIYKQKNNELAATISEISQNFQGELLTEDLDKLVTGLVYDNGLNIDTLVISEPVIYTYNTESADYDANSPSDDSTGTADSSLESGNDSAAASKFSQNIKYSILNVSATGKYKELVKLIDSAEQTAGIAITDINFSSDRAVTENSELDVNFNIYVYMYTEKK